MACDLSKKKYVAFMVSKELYLSVSIQKDLYSYTVFKA